MLDFSSPSKTLANLVDSDLIGRNIFEYNVETEDSSQELQTKEVAPRLG